MALAGERMLNVSVESYSGYKADQRPMRLIFKERIQEVIEIEDRWYSPGETYFRVRVETGEHYVLRHIEAQDTWSVEAYRSDRRNL
jgi:hypothetical protein